MRIGIACAALLLLLAGCTTHSLQELRRTTPTGDPFSQALAQLYLDFSELEAMQYDWWASKYFADKGLMAAYGKQVPPELPENWDISEHHLMELASARQTLLGKLNERNIAANPKKAARMQFYFDCWVEQLEENWQIAEIAHCRDQFFALLDEVDAPVITPVVTTTSYILYFPWDSAELQENARHDLSMVVDDLTNTQNYEVVINGHTDTSGTEPYNMELSQRRAERVRNELISSGIVPERITYFAFGETDPQIPTGDGVREPANRRVEIFLE